MASVYEEILFWERRIKILEYHLNQYARKAAWNSKMIKEVEYIEYCLEECEDELDTLYSEVDKLEWSYD
jgi:hypothetical protein